jgi:hypothetical protein
VAGALGAWLRAAVCGWADPGHCTAVSMLRPEFLIGRCEMSRRLPSQYANIRLNV